LAATRVRASSDLSAEAEIAIAAGVAGAMIVVAVNVAADVLIVAAVSAAIANITAMATMPIIMDPADPSSSAKC